MKKKKRRVGMLGLGVGLIGANTTIGMMPNPTSSAAVSGIKANAATGLANVSSKAPAIGNIVGTGMVLKSFRKLEKKRKKLNFSGGKQIW